jgi:hypothetical protein
LKKGDEMFKNKIVLFVAFVSFVLIGCLGSGIKVDGMQLGESLGYWYASEIDPVHLLTWNVEFETIDAAGAKWELRQNPAKVVVTGAIKEAITVWMPFEHEIVYPRLTFFVLIFEEKPFKIYEYNIAKDPLSMHYIEINNTMVRDLIEKLVGKFIQGYRGSQVGKPVPAPKENKPIPKGNI